MPAATRCTPAPGGKTRSSTGPPTASRRRSRPSRPARCTAAAAPAGRPDRRCHGAGRDVDDRRQRDPRRRPRPRGHRRRNPGRGVRRAGHARWPRRSRPRAAASPRPGRSRSSATPRAGQHDGRGQRHQAARTAQDDPLFHRDRVDARRRRHRQRADEPEFVEPGATSTRYYNHYSWRRDRSSSRSATHRTVWMVSGTSATPPSPRLAPFGRRRVQQRPRAVPGAALPDPPRPPPPRQAAAPQRRRHR